MSENKSVRKPDWLKIRVYSGSDLKRVEDTVKEFSLHTVCREANCPNRGECYGRGTATFMLLGDQCTRNCTFCNVTKAKPGPLDCGEPERVALAVARLKLKFAVLTSVTRDDLSDGGAGHFAETVRQIIQKSPGTKVEVLIPDFQGSESALLKVIGSSPAVINHNVETVPRLYPDVRPMASYKRSLELLRFVSNNAPGILVKSGLMVGLGEREEEVLSLFYDLAEHGCRSLTIGQYLQPSKQHYPVKEYITPERFSFYQRKAQEAGIPNTASAPFVRSSYQAEKNYQGTA